MTVPVSTTDPESKSLVLYRNHPTPIFRKHLASVEANTVKFDPEILSQFLAPATRIYLLVLPWFGREGIRKEFNMRLHSVT